VGGNRETDRRRLGARRLLVATVLALTVALALPALAVAAKWTAIQLPAKVGEEGTRDQVPLYDVSCPGEKLCVAVGALDTVAVSQAPAGGREAWRVTYPTYSEPKQSCLEEPGVPQASCSFPRGSLDAVSCAGEGLCVAVGKEGSIYASADPLSGNWSIGAPYRGPGAPHLTGVSCPATSLCVAVSGENGAAAGRVFTSTAPIAGVWQSAALPGAPDLRAVSCSAATQCMAVGKGGSIYVSAEPTGGAGAWHQVASPTPRDLEGVDCVAGLLCAAGDAGGNVLTTADPTGSGFAIANSGGSVQITGVSCPTTAACVTVDNNADVATSTDPGGAKAWTFENLIPFEAEPAETGQFVKNALWGDSCPSTTLCVLVGANSRVFASTAPFAAPAPSPPAGGGPAKTAKRRRPRTHLVFAEHFYKVVPTRGHRAKARFRFYSRDGAKGFECKRDRHRWARCHSPLRYWAAIGRHVLRVRAIGATGLRGPVAALHFRVIPEPGTR
jgi:hypothetical protein